MGKTKVYNYGAQSTSHTGLQAFAPNKIIEVAAGSTIDVSNWYAYSLPKIPIDVQLNSTGPVVNFLAGTIRGVPPSISTIVFSGFTGTISIEVME